MKSLNTYVSLLMAALFMGCACNDIEQPVEQQQLSDNEAAFRASVSVSGVEDISWPGWEANKDKIGVFAVNESGTLCVNRYYHAFSSTPASKFKSASEEHSRIWNGDAAADVYAYYPFRTSANDPEAIPCSVPLNQKLAPGVFPNIKNSVLFDAKMAVSYMDGLPQLNLKPFMAVVKVHLALSELVNVTALSVVSTSSACPCCSSV